MKRLAAQYVRGWRWEAEHGATHPVERAVLSLALFGIAPVAIALDERGWAVWLGAALILLGALAVHTYVTLDGAKWADADDERARVIAEAEAEVRERLRRAGFDG